MHIPFDVLLPGLRPVADTDSETGAVADVGRQFVGAVLMAVHILRQSMRGRSSTACSTARREGRSSAR